MPVAALTRRAQSHRKRCAEMTGQVVGAVDVAPKLGDNEQDGTRDRGTQDPA